MSENIAQQLRKCMYCGGLIKPDYYDDTIFYCCPFGCSIKQYLDEPSYDNGDDDFDRMTQLGISFE